MFRNENIICISSIDWDFIWQGHQEIMSALAANGNRVLFIENTGVRPPNLSDLPRLRKRVYNWLHSTKGIRKERENLYIFSPIIIPFPYSKIARWINKRFLINILEKWRKSVGFSDPIIWTFLPTGIAIDIVDSIDAKLTVYYCIDNFSASSSSAKRIENTERELLEKVDLVFVTAKGLYDKCSRYNKNVHIFPFGVNIDVYEKSKRMTCNQPEDLVPIRHPVIGYVGGVHKWMDLELIKFLASHHTDKSFVFIGPPQRDIGALKALPNVYFLGQKRYEELPGYVSNFDVCMIPYLLTEYTKNVYPTKINEYLSLGKPVVSTAIPEVEMFSERNDSVIFVGRTKEEFSSLLDKALAEDAGDDIRNRRMTVAEKEGDWKAKIEKMSALIVDKIACKEKERARGWQDNILRLYRRSRRRAVPVFIACAAVYLLLFHTSFIWFMAKPLKIKDTPARSDIVVVLGGGVGESGKAGQGYEERVVTAYNLYRNKIADKVLYSSGYRSIMKEAEVMKALSVALGMDEKDILLDDASVNTYNMVTHLAALAKENGWKKIVVVSSPYHMLRLKLLSDKYLKGISVLFVPVEKNSYYGQEDVPVRLRHIRGIAQEYLAILYYKLKNYI